MSKGNVEAVYRLTPLQEGVLYHALQAPDDGLYFEQYLCVLEGALDVQALRGAWDDVVARHPALRTLFTWERRDRPLQLVRERIALEWTVLDWRSTPREARADALERWLEADRSRGFELTRAPLMRHALIAEDDRTHRFVWSFHHILLDGWSMRLVLDEVLDRYRARSAGREPAPMEAGPAFSDFVAWQRRAELGRAERFWKAELAGFRAPTRIALGESAGADQAAEPGTTHGERELALPRATSSTLAAFARARRVTLPTVVAAAWALLLDRLAGDGDVVLGVTVATRPAEIPGIERMVGPLINTVPLRIAVDPDQTLEDWLAEVQRRQAALSEHQATPLAQIRRWSELAPDEPLFETIVVFENHPVQPGGDDRAIGIREERYVERSNYPLALLAIPGERLRLVAVHDLRRFDARAAATLLTSLRTLLESMVARPRARLAELPMLSFEECAKVLDAWNDTAAPRPAPRLAQEAFEEHADRHPEAIALRADASEVCYGSLDRDANRLANVLASVGVRAGTRVAVCLPRSAEMITGMLAVLKAGAAYVPLDPDYPRDRLRLLIDDAGARVVITLEALAPAVAGAGVQVLALDAERGRLEAASTEKPRTAATPDDLAYVMYTSGSTGRPKGVEVTHRSLLHSTRARSAHYGRDPACFLLMSSFAFDSSVAGIYWTLLGGGALVLPPRRIEQDLRRLGALVAETAATHTLILPTLYGLLLEHVETTALRTLETVIVAGEACPPEVVRRHFEKLPRTRLHNEYGPTEATVWCTVADLREEDGRGRVPIGRPIANTSVYVLARDGQPLPAGAAGELHVGGDGLARGYHGRPELTAERFVTRPLPGREPVRLYRTGDRARFRPDGVLDYLGRADDQVKIRGHRVELEEVEAALAAHASVREAAVVVREDLERTTGEGATSTHGGASAPARRRLVGYVVLDGEGLEPVRRHAAATLPEHMVPSGWVVLERLPRTPNGKIDRRALPDPIADRTGPAAPAAPPRTALERTLVEIWVEVLGVDAVGIHDDFFELGGDSILSIWVISRASKAGIRIAPERFFECRTVAAMAAAAHEEDAPDRQPAAGPAPLTPIQAWFFDHHVLDPAHWNLALRLEGPAGLAPDVLETALGHLVAHHDALRLRFRREDGRWRQRVEPPDTARLLEVIDLAAVDESRWSREIEHGMAALHEGFDLEEGVLLRAMLLDRGPERPTLVLVAAHHLACDVVSWGIVLDDLNAALRSLARGSPVDLGARTSSFVHWSRALAEHARSDAARAELDAWLEIGRATDTSLPVDRAPGARANTAGSARSVQVALDGAETHALLRELPGRLRATVPELLLCAFARAVAHWTGSGEIRLGLEGHGREPVVDGMNLTRTVGWFTSFYPVTLRVDASSDLPSGLASVKGQLRAVPGKGLGFGILRYLSDDDAIRERLAALPAPELAFNYLGQGHAPRDEAAALRVVDGPIGVARSPREARAFVLEVNAQIRGDTLRAEWIYSEALHERGTVARVADAFLEALRGLLALAAAPEAVVVTPSDFPLAELDQGELARLAGLLGQQDADR